MQLTNLCFSLSWVTLTKCSPWVSLNSLPSFLPPSTPTLHARPSLNIEMFHCKSLAFSSVFIYSCVPVLKPYLVDCPAPSSSDFCHTIFLFLCLALTVQYFLVCLFIHGSNPYSSRASSQSVHSWSLNGLSISWYQQIQESIARRWVNSTLEGNHRAQHKQGGRQIPRAHFWSFCFSFELFNLEQIVRVEDWGKGWQKLSWGCSSSSCLYCLLTERRIIYKEEWSKKYLYSVHSIAMHLYISYI